MKIEEINQTFNLLGLSKRLLGRLGEHRVPVSNSINASLLHGVMDNFDLLEDTKLKKRKHSWYNSCGFPKSKWEKWR